MDKTEYIDEIKKELGFLPEHEIKRAEEYFESYFTGVRDPEDVISCLGDAKTAAKSYYKNLCSGSQNKKFNIPFFAAAIAAFFAAPGAFMLSFTVACLFIVLLCLLLALFAAVPAICVFSWIEGAEFVICTLFEPIFPGDKLIQLGIGFFEFGAGLILTWLVAKWYLKMFPWLFRTVTGVIRRGKKK
jgi:uncharacterized membrane protein